LDNTIASRHDKYLGEEASVLFQRITKDFHVYVISNNSRKRVSLFCGNHCKFLGRANKPKTKKIIAFEKEEGIEPKHTVFIGDQLLTDVNIGHKRGYYAILVKPIDKRNDSLITKGSRLFAKPTIKKIKKHCPKQYQELIKEFI
jgi:HAD superfamily phosphatase (TIGR01668 family)